MGTTYELTTKDYIVSQKYLFRTLPAFIKIRNAKRERNIN